MHSSDYILLQAPTSQRPVVNFVKVNDTGTSVQDRVVKCRLGLHPASQQCLQAKQDNIGDVIFAYLGIADTCFLENFLKTKYFLEYFSKNIFFLENFSKIIYFLENCLEKCDTSCVVWQVKLQWFTLKNSFPRRET